MPTMWFSPFDTDKQNRRPMPSSRKVWTVWALLCLLLSVSVRAETSARVKLDPFTVVLQPLGVQSLTGAESLAVRYEVERVLADYLQPSANTNGYTWPVGTSVTFVGVARLLSQTPTMIPNGSNQWALALTMDGLVYFADGSEIPDAASMKALVEAALAPSTLLAALQPLFPSVSSVALDSYSTAAPSQAPITPRPVPLPTVPPTLRPTIPPTPPPTLRPTPQPTFRPTPQPTPLPTLRPTPQPTPLPTLRPTPNPTPRPTANPTPRPTMRPTARPTTSAPVKIPVAIETVAPVTEGGLIQPTEAPILSDSSSAVVEATVATDVGIVDNSFSEESPMAVFVGTITGGLVILLAISMLIVRYQRNHSPHHIRSLPSGTKPPKSREGGQSSLSSGASPTKTVASSNTGDSTGDEDSNEESDPTDRAMTKRDSKSKSSEGSLSSASTIKTKTGPPSPSRFWYSTGNHQQPARQQAPPQLQEASSSSVGGGSSTISVGMLEDMNSWDTTSTTTPNYFAGIAVGGAGGLRSVESFEYKRHLKHTHVVKKDMLQAPGLSATSKTMTTSAGNSPPQYYHPSMMIPVRDYHGALTPTDVSAATLAKESHNGGAALGTDADGAIEGANDIDTNLFFGGATNGSVAAQLASFMTPISTWWGADAEETEEGQSPRDTDSTISMPISLASSASAKRLPMKLRPSTSFPANTRSKQHKHQHPAESDDDSLDFQADWDPDDNSHSDESELGVTTTNNVTKNGSFPQRGRPQATPASPVSETKKQSHPQSPSYRFFEAKVTNKDEQFLLSHSLRNESYKMQRLRNSFSSSGDGSRKKTSRVNETGKVSSFSSTTRSSPTSKTSVSTPPRSSYESDNTRPPSPLPNSIRREITEDDYV